MRAPRAAQVPPATARRQRGYSRNSQEPTFGAAFMLHRRLVDGEWQVCEGTDEDHQPDSAVHRYDRLVGFAVDAPEQEMVERNQELADAERRARSRCKKKSHFQVVKRWALFERFVLQFYPEEPFAKWIVSLRQASAQAVAEDAQITERLSFQAPPALLLISYAQKLRFEDPNTRHAKPDRKGGTIRIYAKSTITSVCAEFRASGTWPTEDNRLTETIEQYEDDEESAPAFDMETALPAFWKALWMLKGWSVMKRICCWAMLLFSICIMARASCVTQFCPLIETLTLPKERHWDKDGLPKYVIVSMTNWKSRKKAHVGKAYPLKIHRNYVDPNYCPVTWLLIYLFYSGHKEGALFQLKGQRLTESQWCLMTNHLMGVAGLRVNGRAANPDTGEAAVPSSGCSNHSIRRSAAQWAGRCGAREMDVRNAGRWRSMMILARYMAQGAVQREDYEDDEDGPSEDPIFRMWVFKRVTAAREGGYDEM